MKCNLIRCSLVFSRYYGGLFVYFSMLFDLGCRLMKILLLVRSKFSPNFLMFFFVVLLIVSQLNMFIIYPYIQSFYTFQQCLMIIIFIYNISRIFHIIVQCLHCYKFNTGLWVSVWNGLLG